MTVSYLSKSPLQLLSGLLALGACAGGQWANAAGTPAGTNITNIATGTFEPLVPGGPSTAQSNLVTTTVQAVCAVSITPNGSVLAPGQSATLLPGETTTFKYTVVNAGNTTSTLGVAGRVETASGFTPVLAVYHDLNNNGVVDTNEPTVSSVNLPADGSANLLVVVSTDQSARGDAFVNLIGSCSGGVSDADNVSRVTVGPPPELAVDKSFSPALVRPGTETTVTVNTVNGGQGDSREVVLTDILTDQLALGLTFVAGSASVGNNVAGAVLEYSADGTNWQTTEPAQVRGVRVRVPTLKAGARLSLSFRMLAGLAAENRKIPNVATATTGGKAATGTATADVRYLPAVAIGPVGNPEAPEGTAADSQSKTFAVVGQVVCFDHTVKNTGDVRDNFTVTVTYPQGAAKAEFQNASGGPLVQPIALDPGQTAFVRVCYTPAQAGALEALLTVNGDRGTSNQTRDLIAAVEGGLPELVKSSSVAANMTVATGDKITYTLSVRNPYTRPLTNVVVSDPVPAHTDFVGASAGGVVAGPVGTQVVTWNLGTLQPGETRTLTMDTAVSTRAVDGEELKNIFNLVSTELPAPIASNEVKTPVWSAKLVILKEVSEKVATYGDRLTYTLRIRNLSPTTPIVDAIITDNPAVGLEYIAGTTTLAGAAYADPTVTTASTGSTLKWPVAVIPAGGEIVLTYATRVTPQATSTLINTVSVVGNGAGGPNRAIASNRAEASTRLDPLKFAPLGDVVGLVYIDRNRNGLYEEGFDTPVDRARVIMAGGRLALTDKEGRYHFFNVQYGTQAFRLDPNTTPYPPLKVPADGDLSGTQTVHVRGLTSVDFPLAPLGGDINVLRRTVLIAGTVRVEKLVIPVTGGYVVNLNITSPTALEEFVLTDPLPAGATLKEGRNSLTGTLSAGETNLTYRLEGPGEDRAATTDPFVSWRY
ncbi:DUF11 domain-containing protein [Deinococcus puniceus]|uniref:DUF11 domain-containing protein n=1 Tax=Deinococcus puniceus TaxID=1182568 RepID=A0A172TCJ7_9DEIO|nr:DUF11 domain-containing protein [Deinococcus puniceus]ANE44711.1 hypothetical protein SU48_02195 [Deinococcus puniceus]